MPSIPTYTTLIKLTPLDFNLFMHNDIRCWDEYLVMKSPDQIVSLQVSNTYRTHLADLNIYTFQDISDTMVILEYFRFTFEYDSENFSFAEYLQNFLDEEQDKFLDAVEERNYSCIQKLFEKHTDKLKIEGYCLVQDPTRSVCAEPDILDTIDEFIEIGDEWAS